MAAASAAAGLVVGALADGVVLGGAAGRFWLYGALAAFVVGYMLWHAVVAGRPGLWRGVAAGAATGVFAPVVCAVLVIVGDHALGVFHGGSIGPGSLLKNMLIAVGIGYFSLYYVGWATIPTGAAIGLVLGGIQRYLSRKPPSRSPYPEKP